MLLHRLAGVRAVLPREAISVLRPAPRATGAALLHKRRSRAGEQPDADEGEDAADEEPDAALEPPVGLRQRQRAGNKKDEADRRQDVPGGHVRAFLSGRPSVRLYQQPAGLYQQPAGAAGSETFGNRPLDVEGMVMLSSGKRKPPGEPPQSEV